MRARRSRLARLLAAALIRGRDAPFIRRDLDDAFDHDVARGLPLATVRRRDLRNIVDSAVSLWADVLRPSAWRPSLVDVRLGLRSLTRTPGLSLVAVCALAIGVPVGLAPMQAVDALERPLHGDPDGRIRTLCFWRDTVHEPATEGDYALWRRSLRGFERLAAYRQTAASVDIDGAALSMPVIETTASSFDVLRTPAMLGRVFTAADERPGAAAVVVIGHDLWRARFGGDRSVTGRPLFVAGEPATVIGVMPPGFAFPTSQQLWVPLRTVDDGGGPRSGPPLVVYGRLADGVTPEAAGAELQTLTASQAAEDPDAFVRLRATVLPAWHLTFAFPTPGGLRALPEFALIQILMLAPLLIACVNVGLLILAQTSTRASEFAVRTALGAGRGRIVTQVFVEFLVLAVIATGVGLLVLDRAPSRVLTAAGITLPYWIDTGLTLATVVRGLTLAAGSAVLAAVVPALRMTGRSIDQNLKRTRASRTGARLGGLPGVLIALDVAVAVVAIGVAGGLWGKVQATHAGEAIDGVRAGDILSVTLDVRSASPQQLARAQAALVDQLRREPDVRAVTFGTALPRTEHPVRWLDVDTRGADATATAGPYRVRTSRVAIDYFDQLEQPLTAGRGFDARDLDAGAHTVIVNTTFAQRAFGTTNVIGKRVRQAAAEGAPPAPWLEIVGVVGHLGAHPLTPSQDDAVYSPLAEGEVNPVRFAIWTRGAPATLVPRVHALAREVDPAAVIAAAGALDQVYEGDWYFLRGYVVAALVLVAVLLSLAASALYAILSLVVTQRTREIGIRVALGASRWGIAREVGSRAVVQIAAGVLLGLPFVSALSYEFLDVTGTGASVPAALAMTAGLGASVLLVVSLTACAVPTRRALRIAPADALRQD